MTGTQENWGLLFLARRLRLALQSNFTVASFTINVKCPLAIAKYQPMPSGIRMAPELMDTPVAVQNVHSLDEVLCISARQATSPYFGSFGPTSKGRFAALVMAYSASGRLEGVWVSDSAFGTPEAALDYAKDASGSQSDLFGGW